MPSPTPSIREIVAAADRLVRESRELLRDALFVHQRLAALFPGDEAIAQRIGILQSLLSDNRVATPLLGRLLEEKGSNDHD